MASAIAHNGGRSQINFNSITGGSGEWPFLDMVLLAGDWTYTSAPNQGGNVSPALRDANGMPTSIQAGGYQSSVTIPSQSDRPGDYVCRAVGAGTLKNPGSLVSGSVSGTNPRFVFTPSGTTLVFGADSMTSYFTEIHILHVDDEAAWLAGEIVCTKFASRLDEARIGIYRFVTWQNGNLSNLPTWELRKPTTYFSYATTRQWRPELWAGDTTNSGDDYSITFGSGGPTDKQVIHLHFNADATATRVDGITVSNGSPSVVTWAGHGFSGGEPIGLFFPSGGLLPAPLMPGLNFYVTDIIDVDHFHYSRTPGGANVATTTNASGTCSGVRLVTLNLNGAGAVPTRNQFGDPVRSTTKPLSTSSGVNVYATLVYDADLNSWLKNGGDSNVGSGGISDCCPPEIMVRICAERGAHPHFVLPQMAADPLTNWASSLASYIKLNGPSWMRPAFEGPNELWNSAFNQTQYAWNKACVHWGTQQDTHNWYGKTLSQLGQAIFSVYGGLVGNGYDVLCGVQGASFNTSNTTSNPRLTSALYVADGGSAAYNWVTAVCTANYFAATEYNTASETTHAADYAAAVGAAAKLVIATAYADTVGGAANLTKFNLECVKLQYQFVWEWSQLFTNSAGNKPRMRGYEGGYSPDINVGETAAVKTLRVASKFVDDVGKALIGGQFASGETVNGTYNDFLGAGGEYPSCFQMGGTNNAWSVLDPNVYVTPTPPQWTAIELFNARRRSVSLTATA